MRKYLFILLTIICATAVQGQIINTVAGTGLGGYTGDGGPALSAMINGPWSTTVSTAGVLYISDANAHVVRKVSTTGVITTVAGTGTAGFTGTGGPATIATLNVPRGIAIDGGGSLFIADQNNHVVRKVSSGGFITTVAGTGVSGYSGDGGLAALAKISYPQNIALDRFGNMVISDFYHVIRKVSTGGIISTLAGTPGISGYSGDGGPATAAALNYPSGMAFDTSGNLFFADNWNNVIRKISTSGIITTVVGTGTAGYAGDGGLAVLAQLNMPPDVTVDSTGKLYICDGNSHVVRKIGINNHAPVFTAGAVDSFRICQNSGTISVDTRLAASDSDAGQTETWSLIYGPLHGTALTAFTALSASGTIIPSGLTYTPAFGYSGQDTFRVRVFDGQGADTITIYANITPFPGTGTIVGAGTVCIGSPDVLTATVPGGVWTMTNSNAIVSSTGIVNGLVYGMDTVVYTVTVSGCTAFTTKEITVLPSGATVTGPSGVCIASGISLTGIPSGGVWTATNGAALVNVIGYVYGANPGLDTIIYTVTNFCGTSVVEHPVLVNTLTTPLVDIMADPGYYVAPGQRDSIYCNLIGGTGASYTYKWYLNDSVIAGATNSYYITDTLRNGDSVTCMVYNDPCFLNTFGWAFFVVTRVGISAEALPGATVAVIPNPTTGIFSVEATLPTSDKQATIVITNVVGQQVYTARVPIENGELKKRITPQKDLPDGMYLVNIITSEGRIVTRFVVSR